MVGAQRVYYYTRFFEIPQGPLENRSNKTHTNSTIGLKIYNTVASDDATYFGEISAAIQTYCNVTYDSRGKYNIEYYYYFTILIMALITCFSVKNVHTKVAAKL